jgi:hypothetical protein
MVKRLQALIAKPAASPTMSGFFTLPPVDSNEGLNDAHGLMRPGKDGSVSYPFTGGAGPPGTVFAQWDARSRLPDLPASFQPPGNLHGFIDRQMI